MKTLQEAIIEFHQNIKLDVEDNSLLKKYKDEAIEGLKKHLEIDVNFDTFLQGSYSVFTGIKSCDEDRDFDIDIGVVFDIDKDDYNNPCKPKEWVEEAMKKQFPQAIITMKNPCVTAIFKGKKEEDVHIDVAVYAKKEDIYHLARGKKFSSPDNRCWEKSDPIELKKLINNHIKNDKERYQFRRCIRYLKRWKDINFKQEHRPTGIGITINAYRWFSAEKDEDLITNETSMKDILALKKLVNKMIMNFEQELDFDTNQYRERLKALNIVEPYTDTYSKMSFNQMEDFKKKLKSLHEDLEYGARAINLNEATKRLNIQFGDSFPIISKEEIAEVHEKNSIITDYPSASEDIHGIY